MRVPLSMGYLQFRYVSGLHPRPWLERTKFSGGRNLSAEERNEARLRAWRDGLRIYQMGSDVFIPEELREELEPVLARIASEES